MARNAEKCNISETNFLHDLLAGPRKQLDSAVIAHRKRPSHLLARNEP